MLPVLTLTAAGTHRSRHGEDIVHRVQAKHRDELADVLRVARPGGERFHREQVCSFRKTTIPRIESIESVKSQSDAKECIVAPILFLSAECRR
jgi:hypothetical protein